MPFSKTLLARARFESPREKSLTLLQMLASLLSFDVEPARRKRLERVRSLVAAPSPPRFADPCEIIRKACSFVSDEASRRRVPLVVHCACSSVRVRDTFSEALTCLLDNAVRANREGYPVLVDVRESADHQALWEIHDAGEGIAPHVLARLGDPCLVSADGGVGVALANAIIQDHEGMLRFESDEGVGTTASVLVPTVR